MFLLKPIISSIFAVVFASVILITSSQAASNSYTRGVYSVQWTVSEMTTDFVFTTKLTLDSPTKYSAFALSRDASMVKQNYLV